MSGSGSWAGSWSCLRICCGLRAVFPLSVILLDSSPSDSLLISVAGMAVYTGYVFMPQHIMAILHYFEVIQ